MTRDRMRQQQYVPPVVKAGISHAIFTFCTTKVTQSLTIAWEFPIRLVQKVKLR